MRGFGISGSHPGLRRNLCVLLTIALIVGSFTCFVNADDFEEEVPEAVAEQVEEVQNDEEEDVAEEAPAEEAVIEAEDEQEETEETAVEEAVAEEAAEEDVNVQDEKVAEEAAVEEDEAEENAEEAEAQAAEVIDIDVPVEEVSVEADMYVNEVPGYNVIVWAPDYYEQSYAKLYSEDIAGRYNRVGEKAVIKTDTTLTADELDGVSVVHIFVWLKKADSTEGKDIISSSSVLKSFVQKGGKLVLNGENDGGSWNFSNPVLEAIGHELGFDFTITGAYDTYSFSFNTKDYPELTKDLSGFSPDYAANIITSDSQANWVIKSNSINILLERQLGNGSILVLSDINWINSGSSAAADQFTKNVYDYTVKHVHNFTYEASDAELTATCAGCPDYSDGITLTIVAPEKTICEDDKTETATLDGLSDFVAATGLSITEDDIVYAGTGSTTYAESSTAPTAAGTYKASLTVSGETISVEYEIKPIEYSFNGSGYSWTKDSTDNLSISASRNWKDDTTIDHFTGAAVDNTAVAAENMTVTKGSVVVELKSSFLNTLSVGSHTITLSFDDGTAISTTFTVKPAPKASPQTGEYTGPAIIVVAAILLAGSVVAGRMAFRKKEEI